MILLNPLLLLPMQKIGNPFPHTLYELIALLIQLSYGDEHMLLIIELIVVFEHGRKHTHIFAGDPPIAAATELIPGIGELRPEPEPSAYFIEPLDIPGECLPHLDYDDLDLFGYVFQDHADVLVGLAEQAVVELVDLRPRRRLQNRCRMPVHRLASLVAPADEGR
jgi:hypothetical protein